MPNIHDGDFCGNSDGVLLTLVLYLLAIVHLIANV